MKEQEYKLPVVIMFCCLTITSIHADPLPKTPKQVDLSINNVKLCDASSV